MFNSIIGTSITPITFMVCVITSIVLGFIVALMHKVTTKTSSNFISSLVILPMLVSVVILLVNGNLGTSVAIVGAFSLIRFRSIPGNSKEIINVFFTMAIGLAVGTGYIAFAVIFTLITCILSLLLYKCRFGYNNDNDRILKIHIPEDLEYNEVFKEIFNSYLKKYELIQVRTVNMGSVFELTYSISLNNDCNEKELIDKIRIRNANLKISLVRDTFNKEAL